MRPRGELRQTIDRAAEQLGAVGAPVCARVVAAHAGIDTAKARQVLRDMERAGELDRRGTQPSPYGRRRALVYAPTSATQAAAQRLVGVTHSWVRVGEGR